MENRSINLIRSLSEHIKKRPVLGIQPSNTFTIYSVLSKYIDYCNSKADIIYSKRASLLREKLNKFSRKCSDIKSYKLKEERSYRIVSSTINKDYLFNTISTNDFIIDSHHSRPNEWFIESDYLLFNGKNNILVKDNTTITVEHRFKYYPISDTNSLRISKIIDDSLTSSGYSPIDFTEESIIYSSHTKKLEVSAILVDNTITETVSVTPYKYSSDTLITSESYTISYISIVPNSNDIAINTIITEEVDTLEQPNSIKYREVILNKSYYQLDIDNLYSITYKSKFLEYENKKVSLSTLYSYEWDEDRLIAIPKDLELYTDEYYISDINRYRIELTKIREDGNKESIELPIFDITDSLFLKYRTKEELLSDEQSIKFILLPPDKESAKIQETTFIEV